MSILKAIVQQTLPKTVYIHTYRVDKGSQKLEGGEQGSGFVYSADGYIITNAHVVHGATGFAVELHDGTILPATLVGASRIVDVAVLKVTPKAPLTPVVFANERAIQVGAAVFAVGMPISERLKRSVTVGRISHPKRFCPWEDAGPIPMVQADITLAQGNSGGGLFNSKGELVGVNTFILDAVSLSSGYVFAMRGPDVQWVADRIIATGYGPWRRRFGASLKKGTTAMARAHGLATPQGVLVDTLVAEGLAEKLGLQSGDLILRIGGYEVSCAMSAVYALMRAEGMYITLQVSRLGAGRFDMPLYLAKRGKKRKTAETPKGFDVFGLQYALNKGRKVCVKAVFPGSAAATEGFVGNEAILQVQNPKTGQWHDVRTIKHLRELLHKYARKGTMLRVEADGTTTLLALSL